MKVLEFDGKSVEDALRKASQQLGVDDYDDLKYEVIEEGKTGIFGFGVSKSAKIRVFCSDNLADIGDDSREIITRLLEKMEINGKVKDLKESESKVYIELESDQSGLLIGKKGKTLEALQFMVNLMVNTKTDSDKKIILDIEDYRAKREKALRKLSQEIAQKVISTGKPWTMEPMNPFERRLVHLSLQNDSRVTTKSEGQGIYRKVKVLPAKYDR